MDLYHNEMSSCSQKVRLALAEKALPWNSIHLNLRAGDHQKPKYLKLNPGSVVPTLVDKGKPVRAAWRSISSTRRHSGHFSTPR